MPVQSPNALNPSKTLSPVASESLYGERGGLVGQLGRFLALGSIALIRGYQRWLSPLLSPACRYTPSCSSYAIGCLRTHSLGRAYWLSLRRILRCHPWGGHGWDPVPERAETRLSAGEGAHIVRKSSRADAGVLPCCESRSRADGSNDAVRAED